MLQCPHINGLLSQSLSVGAFSRYMVVVCCFSGLDIQEDPHRSTSESSIGYSRRCLKVLRPIRCLVRPISPSAKDVAVFHLNTARHWSTNFTRECVSKVLDTVVSSKGTSYSDILKLDAKIREYPALAQASDFLENMSEKQSNEVAIQHTFPSFLRELCEYICPIFFRTIVLI
jgi:hypothetical protein